MQVTVLNTTHGWNGINGRVSGPTTKAAREYPCGSVVPEVLFAGSGPKYDLLLCFVPVTIEQRIDNCSHLELFSIAEWRADTSTEHDGSASGERKLFIFRNCRARDYMSAQCKGVVGVFAQRVRQSNDPIRRDIRLVRGTGSTFN